MKTSIENRCFNRELSWLEFNQRVLDEAFDETNPLLERVKFLAITGSNLDEFFMVRVGGLIQLLSLNINDRGPAGYTTNQQLRAVNARIRRMVRDQYQCCNQLLKPALAKAGIHGLAINDLNEEQYLYLKRLFVEEIFPLLTPRAVESEEDFPLSSGLELQMAVRLCPVAGGKKRNRFALVMIPPNVSRLVTVPTQDDSYIYLPVEDLIAEFIPECFLKEKILECVPFRVTRNADMSVKEEEACDLLLRMQDVLDARKQSLCVRLEIAASASPGLVGFLKKNLGVGDEAVYLIDGQLRLADFFAIARLGGYEELKNRPWIPQVCPDIQPESSVFSAIARQDLLLFHPYDDYGPVIRLIEEAADDPEVLAIKQILYRTSRNSPIIPALCRAAENGKAVTVIVELKARFDEARNIEWAKVLELAGVQVIYGVKGLKTHAKICIVVRREPAGVKRYLHFGTGNYNESTAKLYSDVSYLTCNDEFGVDAGRFFNTITGYSQPVDYNRLAAAPLNLKPKLLGLIEDETQRRKAGQKGLIMLKANAVVDPDIMEALYRASATGVEVLMNIRGVCCLRPGVPGLSENIRVVSVVDRFLEHARIYYFHQGGNPRVFISSADLMQRNLARRVELLVPVEDQKSVEKLIHILKVFFADNVKAKVLKPDGTYTLNTAKRKHKLVHAQDVFCQDAIQVAERGKDVRLKHFETHRPAAD